MTEPLCLFVNSVTGSKLRANHVAEAVQNLDSTVTPTLS